MSNYVTVKNCLYKSCIFLIKICLNRFFYVTFYINFNLIEFACVHSFSIYFENASVILKLGKFFSEKFLFGLRSLCLSSTET